MSKRLVVLLVLLATGVVATVACAEGVPKEPVGSEMIKEMVRNQEEILAARKQEMRQGIEANGTIHRTVAGQAMRQPEKEAEYGEQLGSTPLLNADPAREQARRAYQAGQASQRQRITRYEDDIWAKVKAELAQQGRRFDKTYVEELARENKEAEPYDDTHLYVFISSSVPRATLENYMKALEGVRVAYVLRGLIGVDVAAFKPTQLWIEKILCGDEIKIKSQKCKDGPIDINPNLYRQFGIKEVPAIVYVERPNRIASCGTGEMPVNEFLVWYGDTNPEYVLKSFQQLRPADSVLASLIGKVSPGLWENQVK